jgi:Family of unknown function (DUF6476)
MSDTKVAPDAGSADAAGLSPDLRFLKWLVAALAGTMIAGLITIVALLVTRLPDAATRPSLPNGITLPDGAKAEAVTFGRGWLAVVTDKGEIIVLDAATGAVRQRFRMDAAGN